MKKSIILVTLMTLLTLGLSSCNTGDKVKEVTSDVKTEVKKEVEDISNTGKGALEEGAKEFSDIEVEVLDKVGIDVKEDTDKEKVNESKESKEEVKEETTKKTLREKILEKKKMEEAKKDIKDKEVSTKEVKEVNKGTEKELKELIDEVSQEVGKEGFSTKGAK